MKVTQGRFSFKVEVDDRPDGLTSYAGLPLFLETVRVLGLPLLLQAFLGLARTEKAFSPTELVTAILAAIAVGAKTPQDVALLGRDKGFLRLVGLKRWPSSTRILRFLYWFHGLDHWRGGEEGKAVIPPESTRLRALYQLSSHLARAVQARRQWQTGTIDVDATIIPSNKREALYHYEKSRGYQPCIAYWVEADLILWDEFRDGNVPADLSPLSQIKKAVLSLPNSVKQIYLRSDTALYSPRALRWLDRRDVIFGVSADMTDALRQRIEAVPESAWDRLRKPSPWGPMPTDVEIAEVEFVPNSSCTSKKGKPFRFLAIRKCEDQGHLFPNPHPELDEKGRRWYLAMVSNMWEGTPETVWNWAKERCGTVELVHSVLKNDLAAGVMPCGRFQANAAWFRLNVMTYNVLSAMKTLALPAAMQTQRPATLRYRLLNLAGRVVKHSRGLVLKLPWIKDLVDIYRAARDQLWSVPAYVPEPAGSSA